MDKLPVELEMQNIETDPPSEPLRHLDPQKTRLRNGYSTDPKKPTVKATPTLEIEINGPDQSTESVSEAPAAPSALPLRQYRLFERIVEHDLKYLKLTCKLGILPFDVDVENRRVSPTNSKNRWSFFYFITFTCLVKTAYIVGTLVASLLNPDWLQVLLLPTHSALAIITVQNLIYLLLRPKSLCLSMVLLNAVLSKSERVKSFSRRQLIAAVLPIGCTLLVAIAFGFPFQTTILFQFGTLLQAATTSLSISPAAYGVLRVAAYAMDAFPLFWNLMILAWMVMSHLLILEVLKSWCDDLKTEATRFNLADCDRELVDIQIIIGFFNKIYGELVFILKCQSLSDGVLAFALIFRYGFSGHFVMSLVNLYGGIMCLLLYPLIYEKAALISESFEGAKKSLLMVTADFEDESERAFWRRRVRAIRVASILCGPRPIERQSLPIFYEFFVSTLIDVLLTT